MEGFTSACDLYTKFGLPEVNASGLFHARAGVGLTEKKQGFLASPPVTPASRKALTECSF